MSSASWHAWTGHFMLDWIVAHTSDRKRIAINRWVQFSPVWPQRPTRWRNSPLYQTRNCFRRTGSPSNFEETRRRCFHWCTESQYLHLMPLSSTKPLFYCCSRDKKRNNSNHRRAPWEVSKTRLHTSGRLQQLRSHQNMLWSRNDWYHWKATRGTSILDHVLISSHLSNSNTNWSVTHEAPIGKSDHCTLIIKPSTLKSEGNSIRQHVVYDFRQSHLHALLSHAEALPWNDIINQDDSIDLQWKSIHDRISHLISSTILQKTIKLTPRDACWMTPLTKSIVNEKWAAYRSRNWSHFNRLKAKALIEIRKAKTLWAQKLKQTPYGLWQLTAHLRGKNLKSNINSLISEDNSPQDLADTIAKNIKQNDLPAQASLTWEDDNWSLTFTEEEVAQLLRKLVPCKAPGSDGIPNRIYTLLAPFIAKPMKMLYNNSIARRTFPSAWKSGIIVPIPKTNPPKIDKLRTITLLPSPAKLLEKLILSKMQHKLEATIGPSQHAFRKRYSTTTALLHLHDTRTCLFDDPQVKSLTVLSLDFAKAFDNVDHNCLLAKSREGGLDTGFLLWLASYL